MARQDLSNDTDPWAYVWSLNGSRRDLLDAQRYLIWKSVTAKSAEWNELELRIRYEANAKRAAAAKAQHEVSNPRAGEKMPEPFMVAPTQEGSPDLPVLDASAPEADAYRVKVAPTVLAKAGAANVGPKTVEKMDQLARHRPDLAVKVRTGEARPVTDNFR